MKCFIGGKEEMSLTHNKKSFGKIIETPNHIEIQGKQLTNIVEDSVSTERIGDKVMVTCSFLADEYILIPSYSSE